MTHRYGEFSTPIQWPETTAPVASALAQDDAGGTIGVREDSRAMPGLEQGRSTGIVALNISQNHVEQRPAMTASAGKKHP